MTDPTIIGAAITAAAAVVATIAGFVGARFARRKSEADAASVITSTALSLIAPLQLEVAKLQGSVDMLNANVTGLNSKVAGLEADNRNLRSENSNLRMRIAQLERQLIELGYTPKDMHPPVHGATPLRNIERKVDELLDHDAARDVPGLRFDPQAPHIQEPLQKESP